MARNLKQISSFAIGTLGSRVLGLLRDVLLYATLGLSSWNAAFILAFSLPNLFRRMVGEGAMTSAFVPTFTQIKSTHGEADAWQFFSLFLRKLSLWLGALIGGVMIILFILRYTVDWQTPRYEQGLTLAIWLFPYLLLVSLSAISGAVLQVYRRFFITSLSPVWLNLFMIVGLGGASLFVSEEAAVRVGFLSAGVLVGGVAQLVIPHLFLRSMQPTIVPAANDHQHWEKFKVLFLPALGGAAILQINILISRLFAFSLDDRAISILYLGNRLVEFPLGVFGIAVSTVVFPLLAQHFSSNDKESFAHEMQHGYQQILWISLPSMVGLQLVGNDLLRVGFQWGAFTEEDVYLSTPVLWILCLSIPFYAMATYLTRVLHASHDTRSPMKIAGVVLIVNLVGSAIMMQIWEVKGLALASVLSSAVQWVLLRQCLCKAGLWERLPISFWIKIGGGLLAIFLSVWGGKMILAHFLTEPKSLSLVVLLLLIPCAAASYGLITKNLWSKK